NQIPYIFECFNMFNFYKKLIHYRNGSKALTQGEIENAGLNITEVVSFVRKYEDEEVLVLNNVSDVEVTVKLLEGNIKFDAIDFASDGAAKLQDGALVLPAYSTVILK
nr:hypothetical protein [Chryseolinea sp.]